MNMNIAEIEAQIAVNLTGPMFICREAARNMMELSVDKRPRAIGIVSSVRATEPLASHPYDAGKSGLLHWMRSFAKDIAPYGIKMGAVAPGTVDVTLEPERHGCSHDEYVRRWEKLTPLGGKPVTPDMVAEEMVALLNSRATTGEVRHVDGGFNLMRPLPQRADA